MGQPGNGTLSALLLCFLQVFKATNSAPESTTDSWDNVPDGATVVWKKTRFAGQPLVQPHAEPDECWEAMEEVLAQLLWHMLGSPTGQLDSTKDRLLRCAVHSTVVQ